MSNQGFTDAFLDSQYLKLDEGALAFIFTRERVNAARALGADQAAAYLARHHDKLVRLYGDVTRRILKDAFYDSLFEQLSELEDEIAFAFINLCLRRIQDEAVEAARVQAVQEYQAKRKPKAH
ncbi:MAG: hypothetical protein KF754_00310 [Planctomycetes bacterium]|nr:hypothetical protein [Planctomycetota bacterium]